MVNGVVYRQGVHVGEISAENDDSFLVECFVDQEAYKQLLDMESSKSLILGRTGSGKTALLKYIESTNNSTIRIDPKEISFQYISNSNILKFIMNIGCDITVLFQFLWKHILVCHAIKKYFKDKSSFQTVVDDFFKRKSPAKDYFDKYQSSFWKESDEVIKEITSSFEDDIKGSVENIFGVDKVLSMKGGGSIERNLSHVEKQEIQNRVQHAVSKIQIREMSQAIDSLNKLMDNRQRHFYILIDDLDLDWADPSLRYKLIQALIETIKNFRKLRNVKILSAIRSDVYEKSIASISGEGIQPEKYESITINIIWDSVKLKEMIDKRISLMFKKQYSGRQNITFYNIFPEKIRSISGFDYLCDRTLMRPRDLIYFVNKILEKASGSTQITPKIVSDVEAEYSRKRLDALKYEWLSVHPRIESYISLLNRKTGKIEMKDFAQSDEILEVCYGIASSVGYKDECFEKACAYINEDGSKKIFEFAACVVSVLYKIGAIELKLSKQDAYYASYRNDPVVNFIQITVNSTFKVTPMLWRALGITPNI